MKKLFAVTALCFLFGCKQPQPKQDVGPVPVGYSLNGNKIIFLDAYYEDYLKAARKDYANKDKYYADKIQNPVLKYFYKSYYYGLIQYGFYNPIEDTTGIEANIEAINANAPKMEEIIIAALADCNKNLKDDSMTVYIKPSTNSMKKIIEKMGGITAVTAGSKQILLTIDPSVSTWSDMLKYNVAHEFEHAYWTQMHQKDSNKFDMLSYLIFEGRADSYAHVVYPDKSAPWTSAISDSEKTALWEKIKPDLNSENRMLQRAVMFGSNEYPLWGGYSLGYAIVQSALKNHPELTPVQWANLKPEEILAMSDYK